MAAGTATTIFQSSDTFIVDVAWLAADVTDTVIAHGLGDTPLDVTQSVTTVDQTATATYAGLDYTIDATNLTARKQNSTALSNCTVRYILRRRIPPYRR